MALSLPIDVNPFLSPVPAGSPPSLEDLQADGEVEEDEEEEEEEEDVDHVDHDEPVSPPPCEAGFVQMLIPGKKISSYFRNRI